MSKPMDSEGTATQRRAFALSTIDNAKFSMHHVRAIFVAGAGFYTDAYDIFAVNFANVMVGYVYFPAAGKLSTPQDTAIKIATSTGTVIGQLVFGFLADYLGRKKMYGISMMIIMGATLGLCLTSNSASIEVVGAMIFWRVLLGVGVGGDYPIASIITSEFATLKWRGAMMAAVFSSQGFGQFTAAFVSFLCTLGFKNSLQVAICDAACQSALDKSWRIIYGFGAVPALFALYFRLTIPESVRYTLDVERNTEYAAADALRYTKGKYGSAKREKLPFIKEEAGPPKASFHDFIHHFRRWKNGKVLLGAASSWFVLDIAFYGLGLNTSIILGAIGYNGGGNIYEKLYNNGVGNLILSCAGLIPGYWVTVATVDTIGRKTIQIGGFTILTILFSIIGFGFHTIPTSGLFALYCLCNFFQNFGPNTTTFLVPGEVFPTRYRSTAFGMCAASGKVGAIIAQSLLGPLKDHNGVTNSWLNHVMEIFALFMLIGIFTSMLIPETARKTLEELAGEEDTVPLISPGRFKEETPSPILEPIPVGQEGDDSSESISPGFKENPIG